MKNTKYTEDEIRTITEDAGYIYNSFYRNESGQIYVGFVCKKHEYKGVQYVLLAQLRNKKKCCGVCNGNNRNTEDFKYMLHDILPDVEVIGEYTGARKRIGVRCKIDGNEWSPFAYNLLNGYGCQECFNRRRQNINHISSDQKLNKLQSIHADVEFLEVPHLARDNVSCRCKICGCEWQASYDNLTKENYTGCPVCESSKGERNIAKLLREWDVKFDTQKTYPDLIDKDLLRFDFYLPDFNILIEYDGEYHFRPVFYKNINPQISIDNYAKQVIHDRMKNDYCANNGITLIRIPYWEYDDLEYYLFDQLIRNKILEEI